MYDLRWSWGMSKDDRQWTLMVEAVDTDMYALAYYSVDEKDPKRIYESNDPELLKQLIDSEYTEIYAGCLERVKMHFFLKEDSFKDVTVANFM